MRAGNLKRRTDRKNGPWRYKVSYGSGPDRKRIVRDETFGDWSWTQTKAEKHATQLKAKWDREHEARANYRGTMNELIDAWLINAEHSPTTTHRNESIMAAIRKTFGAMKVIDVTPFAINTWKNELAKPYRKEGDKRDSKRVITRGPVTIRQYLAWLEAILEWGYDLELVESNPARRVKRPKVKRKDRAEFMPTMEALEVMLGHTKNMNLRMAVRIAAATGCRAGEIAALRWSDLRDGVLYVSESGYKLPGEEFKRKSTKADKPKVIVLRPPDVDPDDPERPRDLLDALQEHRVWQVEQCAKAGETAVWGPILANPRDDLTAARHYPPGWMGKEWRKLCNQLGTPPYVFHGLRHFHGSSATNAGVSIADVANRQGHSVQVAADIYTHPIKDSDIEAARVIAGVMSPLFALPQGEPQ